MTKTRTFRGWRVGEPGSPYAGRAALRDATFFRAPGRPAKYHIIADDGGAECSAMTGGR